MTEFGLDGFAARLPFTGGRGDRDAAPGAAHKDDHTPAEARESSMLSATAAGGDALRPAVPTSVEMSPVQRRHRNRLVGGSAVLAALVAAGALAWPALAGNRGGGNSSGDTVAVSTTPPVDAEPTATVPAYNLDDRCPDPVATTPETRTFKERSKPPKYIRADVGMDLINNAGTNGLTLHEAAVQAYARQLDAVERKLDWAAGFTDPAKVEEELQTILEGEGDAEDDYSPFRSLVDVVKACAFNRSLEPHRDYRIRLSIPDTERVYGGGITNMHAEEVVLDVFSMEGSTGTLAASYSIDALELGTAVKDDRDALTIQTVYNLGKPLVLQRRD